MIVTVSADQVAKLPDGFVIAKPGFTMTAPAGEPDAITVPHPPDDLVAVTEPCQTCGGNPSAEDHMCSKSRVVPVLDIRKPGEHCDCSWENDVCHWCGIEWLGDGDYRCPDCDNAGHPLFDLKVECGKCKGTGVEVRGGHYFDCGGCNTGGMGRITSHGLVTHAGLYVPGPLLPVLADLEHDDLDVFVYAPAFYPVQLVEGDTLTQLDIFARPGWYAAIAERSET